MTISELLNICIDENLIDLTISGPKNKEVKTAKIKVRPVKIKDAVLFQASEFVGTKVLHENYGKFEIKSRIEEWITADYKQAQFNTTEATAQILSGKKGNLTIKYKKSGQVKEQRELSHNRTKSYVLKEGVVVDFLVDLGVQSKDGRIVKAKYDKYRQINRFLEFIEDILPQLDKNKKQTIIDFGCGKSYLTFAMYYYLKVLKGYDIRVIGLDLKEDVIETCNRLKERYGYDQLDFYVGDIASYKDVDSVDMVVTLHACDTATDYALAKAVSWGAKVILSVPCCQHEANYVIANELMEPVFKYGLLKERMAALITDGIRAERLAACGYQTQILEFIDMEHTPKNLLIRAVYTGRKDTTAKEAADRLEQEMNLNLTLGNNI